MECSPKRGCRKDSGSLAAYAEVVRGGWCGGGGKSCKCKAGMEHPWRSAKEGRELLANS